MLRTIFLSSVIGLTACASRPPSVGDNELEALRFLEGRWRGVGPDGVPFFEEYDFPARSLLRSRRFADDTFAVATDESTVATEGGAIVSRWGNYNWRASEIGHGRVCFDPISAPSSFCWTHESDTTVAVTQRWTDEAGAQQSYVVTLHRLG